MSANFYAQAVNIVHYSGQEHLAAVAVELASRHPGLFVRASQEVSDKNHSDSIDDAIRNLVKDNKIVEAIRLHRQMTGSSLLVAKNYVSSIRKEG